MIMWRIVKHTEIAPWHYRNDALLFRYHRRLLAKARPEPDLRYNVKSGIWEETIRLKYSKNGDLQMNICSINGQIISPKSRLFKIWRILFCLFVADMTHYFLMYFFSINYQG